METLGKAFERLFYFWSIEDWKREIKENYRYLRGVQEDATVKMLESLNEKDKYIFAKSLVKRHKSNDWLAKNDEPLSSKEKEYADEYLNMYERFRWEEALKIKPGDFVVPKNKKIKRKQLIGHIIESFSTVIGNDYEIVDGEEIIFNTTVENFNIKTSIDVGGRFHRLCYCHDVYIENKERIAQNHSILQWLGITGQTMWENVTSDNLSTTVQTLTEICNHFIVNISGLLIKLEKQ